MLYYVSLSLSIAHIYNNLAYARIHKQNILSLPLFFSLSRAFPLVLTFFT